MIVKVATKRKADKAAQLAHDQLLRLHREYVVDHMRSTSSLHRCRVWSSISELFLQTTRRTRLTMLGPRRQHEAI